MKTTSLERRLPREGAKQEWLASTACRAVQKGLEAIEEGHLRIVQDGRTRTFGRPGSDLDAEVHVLDERMWSATLLRGTVGVGEAWMRGWWESPDVVKVVQLFVRNFDVMQAMEGGMAKLPLYAFRFAHWLRKNSQRVAEKNIAEHYDLSNDFFSLFLDDTMTYSSGIFETPKSTLEEASFAKLDRLCQKLDLKPGEHLLEIGTGWGALAVHAAKVYGCRVTTTTISNEQHDYAQRKIREAGLEDRVTLLLKDYRELEGQYDKAVSVEMIEAVGHHYFETYFEKVSSLLKPDGAFAMQAIVIADHRYEGALKAVDFIQRYIFPGATIPSVTALNAANAATTNMRMTHLEDITPHYARTLELWRDNLYTRRERIRELGYSQDFFRMWEFYLAYCEGGFAERHIGCTQLVFSKPRNRVQPKLAPLCYSPR